jgi:lysophospholipase L1-like esterase
MKFFDSFVSCTAAGSGSQNWFGTDDPEKRIACRVYYKLSRATRECALLYSNLLDSTYADGSHSHANFVPGSWTIHSLSAGKVTACGMEESAEPDEFVPVTFDGQGEKRVDPGEIFASDPFPFPAKKGEYMCVEMTFSGKRVPCHTESLLPAFRLVNGAWTHSTEIPFPSMVGAKRTGETRLGFIGDSITQGIGTPDNSYTHVAARVQEALGENCAVWNLGLGFGRAHDAALDGGWLYKARQNDAMVVCYGVNDLFQLGDAELLKRDLTYIVRALKQSGLKVLIQTVPPFDYAPEFRDRWLSVNEYIRNELSKEADALFDNVPVLSRSESEPWLSRYGAHPDAEGNAAWAEAILPVIKKLLL